MKYLLIAAAFLSLNSTISFSHEVTGSTANSTLGPTVDLSFSAAGRKLEMNVLKNDVRTYELNSVMTSFLESKVIALKTLSPEAAALSDDEVISLIKEEYLN